MTSVLLDSLKNALNQCTIRSVSEDLWSDFDMTLLGCYEKVADTGKLNDVMVFASNKSKETVETLNKDLDFLDVSLTVLLHQSNLNESVEKHLYDNLTALSTVIDLSNIESEYLSILLRSYHAIGTSSTSLNNLPKQEPPSPKSSQTKSHSPRLSPEVQLSIALLETLFQSIDFKSSELCSQMIQKLVPLLSDLTGIHDHNEFGVLSTLSGFINDYLHRSDHISPSEFDAAVSALIGISVAQKDMIQLLLAVSLLIDRDSTEFLPVSAFLRDLRDISDRWVQDLNSEHEDSSDLWVWGRGENGRLGINSMSPQKTPVKLSFFQDSKLAFISTFANHCLAVDASGTVFSWGKGDNGRLGHESSGHLLTPTSIPSFRNIRVSQVSCGLSHSLFLTAEGTVFSCGDGGNGRLGHGDFTQLQVPKQIKALEGTRIKSVHCGAYHSAAIDSESNLFTWGKNESGQLGLGTRLDHSLPQLSVSVFDILRLSCGWEHNLLVTVVGRLYVWGSGYENSRPVLGLEVSQATTPTLLELDTRIVDCAAGWDHSLCVDEDGVVYSWGDGLGGRLGHGNTLSWSKPKAIASFTSEFVVSVFAGCDHSAAITDGGVLYCWGGGGDFQLGNGTGTFSCVPLKVDVAGPIKNCALGDKFTMALQGLKSERLGNGSSETGRFRFENEFQFNRLKERFHFDLVLSKDSLTVEETIHCILGYVSRICALEWSVFDDSIEELVHSKKFMQLLEFAELSLNSIQLNDVFSHHLSLLCCLQIFKQYIPKCSVNVPHIDRIQSVCLSLIELSSSNPQYTQLEHEACQLITAGLHLFYPSFADKNAMLMEIASGKFKSLTLTAMMMEKASKLDYMAEIYNDSLPIERLSKTTTELCVILLGKIITDQIEGKGELDLIESEIKFLSSIHKHFIAYATRIDQKNLKPFIEPFFTRVLAFVLEMATETLLQLGSLINALLPQLLLSLFLFDPVPLDVSFVFRLFLRLQTLEGILSPQLISTTAKLIVHMTPLPDYPVIAPMQFFRFFKLPSPDLESKQGTFSSPFHLKSRQLNSTEEFVHQIVEGCGTGLVLLNWVKAEISQRRDVMLVPMTKYDMKVLFRHVFAAFLVLTRSIHQYEHSALVLMDDEEAFRPPHELLQCWKSAQDFVLWMMQKRHSLEPFEFDQLRHHSLQWCRFVLELDLSSTGEKEDTSVGRLSEQTMELWEQTVSYRHEKALESSSERDSFERDMMEHTPPPRKQRYSSQDTERYRKDSEVLVKVSSLNGFGSKSLQDEFLQCLQSDLSVDEAKTVHRKQSLWVSQIVNHFSWLCECIRALDDPSSLIDCIGKMLFHLKISVMDFCSLCDENTRTQLTQYLFTFIDKNIEQCKRPDTLIGSFLFWARSFSKEELEYLKSKSGLFSLLLDQTEKMSEIASSSALLLAMQLNHCEDVSPFFVDLIGSAKRMLSETVRQKSLFPFKMCVKPNLSHEIPIFSSRHDSMAFSVSFNIYLEEQPISERTVCSVHNQSGNQILSIVLGIDRSIKLKRDLSKPSLVSFDLKLPLCKWTQIAFVLEESFCSFFADAILLSKLEMGSKFSDFSTGSIRFGGPVSFRGSLCLFSWRNCVISTQDLETKRMTGFQTENRISLRFSLLHRIVSQNPIVIPQFMSCGGVDLLLSALDCDNGICHVHSLKILQCIIATTLPDVLHAFVLQFRHNTSLLSILVEKLSAFFRSFHESPRPPEESFLQLNIAAEIESLFSLMRSSEFWSPLVNSYMNDRIAEFGGTDDIISTLACVSMVKPHLGCIRDGSVVWNGTAIQSVAYSHLFCNEIVLFDDALHTSRVMLSALSLTKNGMAESSAAVDTLCITLIERLSNELMCSHKKVVVDEKSVLFLVLVSHVLRTVDITRSFVSEKCTHECLRNLFQIASIPLQTDITSENFDKFWKLWNFRALLLPLPVQLSENRLAQLTALGFPPQMCSAALSECGDDEMMAVEWLLSNAESWDGNDGVEDFSKLVMESVTDDSSRDCGLDVFADELIRYKSKGRDQGIVRRIVDLRLLGLKEPEQVKEEKEHFWQFIENIAFLEYMKRIALDGVVLLCRQMIQRILFQSKVSSIGFDFAIEESSSFIQFLRLEFNSQSQLIEYLQENSGLLKQNAVYLKKECLVHFRMASTKKFAEIHWGDRANEDSESTALAQPSVEFAYWVFDILLSLDTQLIDSSLIDTLFDCFLSASAPLKFFASLLLTQIGNAFLSLRQNCQHLFEYLDHSAWDRVHQFMCKVFANEEKRLVKSRLLCALVDLRAIKSRLQSQHFALRHCEDPLSVLRAFQIHFSFENVTFESIDVYWRVSGQSKFANGEHFKVKYQLQRKQTHDTVFSTVAVTFSCSFRAFGLFPFKEYQFRLRPLLELEDQTLIGDWIPERSVRTQALLSWDSNCPLPHRGVEISFFHQNLTVKLSKGVDKWMTLRGNKSFRCEDFSFDVRINVSVKNYIFIGVVSASASLDTFVGADSYGYGLFLSDRCLYHGRGKQKLSRFGELFGSGDVVTVKYSHSGRSIRFLKNGRDIGLGFEDMPKRLEMVPAVSLFHSGDVVSICENFKEFDVPTEISERDSMIASVKEIGRVIEWVSIAGMFVIGDHVPREILERAFMGWNDWIRDSQRVFVVSGTLLQVNVDMKVCKSVNVVPGCVLCIPGIGSGRILGVVGDKVVVSMDGSGRCDFFDSKEIEEYAEDQNWKEYECLWSNVESVQSLCGVESFEEFLAFVDGFQWNYALAVSIVRSVHSYMMKQTVPLAIVSLFDITRACASIKSEFTVDWVTIAVYFRLIYSFNALVLKTSAFLNYTSVFGRGFTSSILNSRELIFQTNKLDFLSKAVNATMTVTKASEDPYEDPAQLKQVSLNRLKSQKALQHEDIRIRKKYSLFQQMFDQLYPLPSSELRRSYVHMLDDGQERTFKVKFIGEGVQDNGGPYRECFHQIFRELVDPRLGYFVASPNNREQQGLSQDAFIVNPGCTEFSRYEFIGKMIGIAIRHGIQLDLPLSQRFWKRLVGMDISISDLDAVDVSVSKTIGDILSFPLGNAVTVSVFNSIFDFDFSTILSDGETVEELCKDGKGRRLTAENRDEWCQLMMTVRLNENRKQIDAIRRGLDQVIPLFALRMFTPTELYETICGTGDFDCNLLKSVTIYEGKVSESDAHIKYFWNVLESFSSDQKCAFIRFVWARSRIPHRASEFGTKFKLQQPLAISSKDPDAHLPQSHTCFFSLSLPKYSSEAVLRQKLVYAIENCGTMNLDLKLQDNELYNYEEEDLN